MRNITTLSGFKKIFFLLILAELFNFSATANPGDTTWVTVFNLRKIPNHGAFDTTAVFPTGKRYRKIRMHYILGVYGCQQPVQYCHDWDYTTEVRVLPPGKDSVEIARVITPYAHTWTVNKPHDYIVDVTDYATVLDGSTAMRYFYDGYSWGFTLTLKFEMIEGVPPMDALSVKNVYDGYYTYGAASTSTNYIENYLTAKTFSYNAPVTRPFLKNTVSGHGSDNANCSEFCSKYYKLNVNGNQVSQVQLWRSSCGMNEVFPQSGTWIYERANWCPGEWVHPIYHDLTSLTSANTSYTVDVDMQPYTTGNPSAGYNWVSQIINYSAPNYSMDASIEDIVSPTKDDNYLRENPTCASPSIKLKNTGTSVIHSVVFNYGLHGQAPFTYTFTTDSLKFLEDTLVVFPSASSILSNTANANSTFEVSVQTVNGQADQNPLNNMYASSVPTITVFNKPEFIVSLTATSDAGENTWNLYDDGNNLLYSGDVSTGAVDVQLDPGCYYISLDDSGCDGMSFLGTATGTMKLYNPDGVTSFFTFPGDFGCNYTKYFTIVQPEYVGIQQQSISSRNISIYPNPANSTASIKLNLGQSLNVKYRLMDITGKTIQQKNLNKIASYNETLDISQLENGIYLLAVDVENNATVTKKLVVQK